MFGSFNLWSFMFVPSMFSKVVEKFEKGNEKLVRLEMQAHTPEAQTIIAEAVIALE